MKPESDARISVELTEHGLRTVRDVLSSERVADGEAEVCRRLCDAAVAFARGERTDISVHYRVPVPLNPDRQDFVERRLGLNKHYFRFFDVTDPTCPILLDLPSIGPPVR